MAASRPSAVVWPRGHGRRVAFGVPHARRSAHAAPEHGSRASRFGLGRGEGAHDRRPLHALHALQALQAHPIDGRLANRSRRVEIGAVLNQQPHTVEASRRRRRNDQPL